jgi:hypothetical protein
MRTTEPKTENLTGVILLFFLLSSYKFFLSFWILQIFRDGLADVSHHFITLRIVKILG